MDSQQKKIIKWPLAIEFANDQDSDEITENRVREAAIAELVASSERGHPWHSAGVRENLRIGRSNSGTQTDVEFRWSDSDGTLHWSVDGGLRRGTIATAEASNRYEIELGADVRIYTPLEIYAPDLDTAVALAVLSTGSEYELVEHMARTIGIHGLISDPQDPGVVMLDISSPDDDEVLSEDDGTDAFRWPFGMTELVGESN